VVGVFALEALREEELAVTDEKVPVVVLAVGERVTRRPEAEPRKFEKDSKENAEFSARRRTRPKGSST